MLTSAETQTLVGALGLLAIGILALLSAILVRRKHPTAIKWFGSSSQVYIRMGIFATASGLLNLGRLVVPERYAGAYSQFFLASAILLVVGLIISVWRTWRTL